jgi:hypothetical protein
MTESTHPTDSTGRPAYLRIDAPAKDIRAKEEARLLLLAKSRHWHRRGIIRKFGTWAVTRHGVETIFAPADFSIGLDRLGMPGWHDRMRSMLWVVIDDFDAALTFARKRFGISGPAAANGQDSKHEFSRMIDDV